MVNARDFIETLSVCLMQGDLEGSIRRYSGRGMYGKECVGFSTLDDSEWDICSSIEDRGRNHLVSSRDIGSPAKDNMGMGMIYYWPNIEVPEDFDENDYRYSNWN